MSKEFLVTAQAYSKKDPYKQTIILHESFFVDTEDSAETLFKQKFDEEFNIMQIYSTVDINNGH